MANRMDTCLWQQLQGQALRRGDEAKRWMLGTQGQSLQLWADGQVEADVVITTDSLLTLHLIQRRDSVLGSFILKNFVKGE